MPGPGYDQAPSQDNQTSQAAPETSQAPANAAPAHESEESGAQNHAAPAPGAAVGPESQRSRDALNSHYADPPLGAANASASAPEEKSTWQRIKDWWSSDSKPATSDGAGGAGGAPSTGNGAEGSNAGGPEKPASEASPAQTDQPKSETKPAETPAATPAAAPAATTDDKSAAPPRKLPSDMTPEELAADKTAKMAQYGNQSDAEKKARWAQNDGKLPADEWAKIQAMKDNPEAQKQAMLQAGLRNLDYDDPRRAQLEKIQTDMNGKNSRTGGEYKSNTAQTGCGGTVNEMLQKGTDPKQPAFPGYIKGGEREALPTTQGQDDLKNAANDVEKKAAQDKINAVTPKSGDVYELKNPNGDVHGHAGTFCVASPDGKTWLTYDGGQQSRESKTQEIKLGMRNVSVDAQGRTIVGAPGSASGTDADNHGRPVSATYDYQKMYDKNPGLHPPTNSQ